MDDVLSEFRAQWQKELKVSSDVKPQTNKPSTDVISENGISIENKVTFDLHFINQLLVFFYLIIFIGSRQKHCL